jgi:hypothetical protein
MTLAGTLLAKELSSYSSVKEKRHIEQKLEIGPEPASSESADVRGSPASFRWKVEVNALKNCSLDTK